MKQLKMVVTGLTMSVLVAACGKSKDDNGSKAPAAPQPPPVQQTTPQAQPKKGGDIPVDGPRVVAPESNGDGILPGVPYSPTPVPLKNGRRGGSVRTEPVDPNMTPQERLEVENEKQRRRRREEDRERRRDAGRTQDQEDRRGDQNGDRPAPPTTNGGIDNGPAPLPPTSRKSNENPVVVKPKAEETSGSKWFPPEVYKTPAKPWLEFRIEPMLKSVRDAGPAPRKLKNRVKVTLALGYFDGYHVEDLKYEGVNYGRHVATDVFLRSAVDSVLTRDCHGQKLQVCGFELKSVNDVEAIYFRGGVDDIIQEVRVLSGAIDARYAVTTGAKAAQQQKRTARAKEAFEKSFLDSDLVVYVGHSRLGGGPDFAPPRLTKSGKQVDYPSYQKEKAGEKLTLRAIKNPNRRANVFAMLSCDSTAHFANEIRKAGPDLQLATMTGDIRAEDQMAGGLLAVDLFLRQGSLKGYQTFVSGNAVLGSAVTVQNGSRAAGR